MLHIYQRITAHAEDDWVLEPHSSGVSMQLMYIPAYHNLSRSAIDGCKRFTVLNRLATVHPECCAMLRAVKTATITSGKGIQTWRWLSIWIQVLPTTSYLSAGRACGAPTPMRTCRPSRLATAPLRPCLRAGRQVGMPMLLSMRNWSLSAACSFWSRSSFLHRRLTCAVALS